MKKVIGYVISTIGIISLALAVIAPLRESLKLPPTFTPASLTLIGLLIIVLGIIILYASKSKKGIELPIYEGKKVVGYRRL